MGNCHAIDAAALVVQHPSGKLDRLYWAVKASEVMRLNPGHYVALLIPLPMPSDENDKSNPKIVRFTRVKLLRPSDTLQLGHAYRLVTTQEVMRVLKAKKQEKKERKHSEDADQKSGSADGVKEKQRPSNLRSKSWRPSLQRIEEVVN